MTSLGSAPNQVSKLSQPGDATSNRQNTTRDKTFEEFFVHVLKDVTGLGIDKVPYC